MNKAKKLLLQYRNIINKLRDMDVIRTGKVVSDYGEYVACKKFKLKRAQSTVNKGFDAVDKRGKKYEIKTRKATAWNKPGIFPVKKSQLKIADFLIYVEFDDDWNIVILLKIPTKKVKPNVHNRVVINKTLIEKYSVLK